MCYPEGVWKHAGIVLAAIGCGCRGQRDDAVTEPPPAPQVAPVQPGEPVPAPAAKPDFPDGTRSLQLMRTVSVRLEPASDGKQIGTIGIDTRVAWKGTQAGHGCMKSWVEIEPRGWVCGDYLKPTDKLPYGQEVPHLDRGEIVPGVYGKVTAPGPQFTYLLQKPEKKKPKKDRDKKKPHGRPVTTPSEVDEPEIKEPKMVEDKPIVGSLNVRQYDTVTMAGQSYWKVGKDNQYVLASSISRHTPSGFAGTRLGDDTGWAVPFAFVWPRNGYVEAYTLVKPTGGGVVRSSPVRTPVPVLATETDKAGKPIAYRIADGEWMSAADIKVFAPVAPPALLQPDERWIDVDLDAQILVAFEGTVPVYATLISSGAKETPTKTGIYRIWVKESEADMTGLNGEDPYSVATVPWTEFFSPEDKYALHTAYWHDSFGHQRSHGCVNLAPRDARWLYFWSDPQVPPGWTMAAGNVDAPGSIVRVRSAADPNPETRGYAKKVLEARQQNAPG